MTVVSITLPSQLLRKFEEFMELRGYYSRSEAFRDAIRNLMSEWEFQRLKNEKVAATIMVTNNQSQKEVNLKMAKLRHEFEDIIVENIHRHLNHKYCLEIFIVEGEHSRVLELTGRIRGMKGILQIKTVFMPL